MDSADSTRNLLEAMAECVSFEGGGSTHHLHPQQAFPIRRPPDAQLAVITRREEVRAAEKAQATDRAAAVLRAERIAACASSEMSTSTTHANSCVTAVLAPTREWAPHEHNSSGADV